jgi:hypothetical protein
MYPRYMTKLYNGRVGSYRANHYILGIISHVQAVKLVPQSGCAKVPRICSIAMHFVLRRYNSLLVHERHYFVRVVSSCKSYLRVSHVVVQVVFSCTS